MNLNIKLCLYDNNNDYNINNMGNSDSSDCGSNNSGGYSDSVSSGGNWSTSSQSPSTNNSSQYDGSSAQSYGEACSKGFSAGIAAYHDNSMATNQNPASMPDSDHYGKESAGQIGAGIGGCLGAMVRKGTAD